MQAASLTEIEREIVDDILAVCRRCGWPTDMRPKFDDYLYEGGDVYEKQIKQLGGWERLSALAGMRGPKRIAKLPVVRPAAVDLATLTPGEVRENLLADLRAVAMSLRLKPGYSLTYAEYRRGGGVYWNRQIKDAGGWTKVSASAGYPSRPGAPRRPRHQWKKTAPTLTPKLDAALDAAIGHTPIPRGFLRLVRGRPAGRRGPMTVYRQTFPVLERGEVIADIRAVALSLGLVGPHLLTFDTYRNHGGRYTYEQTATLGGFDALRRAA
jgi:hypothetical protein